MFKSTFVMLAALASTTSPAQELSAEMKAEALAVAGFVRLADSADASNFTFEKSDEKVAFVISKNALSSRAEAIGFCAQKNKKLAGVTEVLLLAVAGASSVDAQIKEALVINLRGQDEEAPFWIPDVPEAKSEIEAGNDLFAVESGMSVVTYPLAEINVALKERGLQALKLRAICVDKYID